MPLVVDTSIIIACVTNGPNNRQLLQLLDGHLLYSSASLPWELGNAFSAMFKQRRISPEQAIAAFEQYREMPIELKEINVVAAIQLAHQLRIYAYDAYILQCTIESSFSLLTLDGGLATAARMMKLPIQEFQP